MGAHFWRLDGREITRRIVSAVAVYVEGLVFACRRIKVGFHRGFHFVLLLLLLLFVWRWLLCVVV